MLFRCRGSSPVERGPEKAGVGSSTLPLGTTSIRTIPENLLRRSGIALALQVPDHDTRHSHGGSREDFEADSVMDVGALNLATCGIRDAARGRQCVFKRDLGGFSLRYRAKLTAVVQHEVAAYCRDRHFLRTQRDFSSRRLAVRRANDAR